jgi:hypothetical protein
MEVTRMSRARAVYLASLCFALTIGCSLLVAQTDCPDIPQAKDPTTGKINYGVVQSAQVTVEAIDNTAGQWDQTQLNAVEQAAQNIMAQPGDNGDATIVNTDTASSKSAASLAKPIVVVQMTTDQNYLDKTCGTASVPHPTACTDATFQITGTKGGNAYYATVTVLASFVSNSGNPFEQLMSHEFGHALLGYGECDGCADTIANPIVTSSSPTGPTNCDNQQSKKDWCRCNLGK